jgi:hypothetical protein
MGNFIENREGRWWVPNPAHEEENFADKWNEYPERRNAFVVWRNGLSALLSDVVQLEGKGLPAVAARCPRVSAPTRSPGPPNASVSGCRP